MTEIQLITLRTIIVCLIVSVFTSVLVLAQPIYMMQIMLNVLPSRNMSTLVAISIVILIAFFLSGVLDFFRSRIIEAAILKIESIVNARIIEQYLSSDSETTFKIEPLKDMAFIRKVSTSRVSTSLLESIAIPFIIFIVFYINYSLGIIFVIGIAVYFLSAVASEYFARNSRSVLGKISEEANICIDREVRAGIVSPGGVLHGAYAKRYLAVSKRFFEAFVPGQRISGAFGNIKSVIRQILQSLVLGIGAYLAIHEKIEIGVVIGVSLLASRALGPIDGIVGGWGALLETREAIKRVGQSLSQLKSVRPRLMLPRPEGRLAIESLCYCPKGLSEPVLKDINFNVNAGEVVAIIGPAGSGKSTLLRLLSGRELPSAGHVRLDGNDLRNWRKSQLEEYVGFMGQENTLLDGTIADIISRFDPQAQSEEIVQAASDASFHNIILGYPDGYNTHVGPKGVPLPAGHKQFLCIARALYKRTALVLLDEPTAFLDADGDRRLAKILEGLRDRSATVILVTQRPGILQHVDRVVVLNSGRLQMIGNPDQVSDKRRIVRPAS